MLECANHRPPARPPPPRALPPPPPPKPPPPPPKPPPKGAEAMSTMRLLASGYSAKVEMVSTISAHMCDYGEDV